MPSFHETFLSGSDEIGMRWEYCTKMTFAQHGFAEWHSMATYKDEAMFDKVWTNYVNDLHWDDNEKLLNATDKMQHVIQLDLAIYDEA
jgi:hypothetical protein